MSADHHGQSPSGEAAEPISGDDRPDATVDNDDERGAISTGLRDAPEAAVRDGFRCDSCGRFNVTAVVGLFARRRAGSAQRFCDPACRQAAYRRRRAGVQEDTPLQLHGGRSRRLNTSPDQNIGWPATSPKPGRSTNGGAV